MRHYYRLRCIFIAACVQSGDGADMGLRTFKRFCTQAKIVDNNITSRIIDTYWKAANFEEIEQEGNDDNSLIRFEFLEMLVRISKGKFVEFGNMSSIAEGLEKLIITHVLPVEN